jgi:putative Ca2+/H+ antiporter (TMEM165/GDT1 family)
VNLAVAATTLALVVPAELPDKTFISCIVLSSRYRALPVWLGASAALVLQAAIAVVAGRLLDLLPHRAVEGVVAALFLGGAAYLLFVPEKVEEEKGEKLGDKPEAVKGFRVALTAFTIVALAEFGDITQVLIANLSARYHDPLSVFTGASVGFCLVSIVGVVGGKALTRYVPLAAVRRISGLALLGFGIYTIVGIISP